MSLERKNETMVSERQVKTVCIKEVGKLLEKGKGKINSENWIGFSNAEVLVVPHKNNLVGLGSANQIGFSLRKEKRGSISNSCFTAKGEKK